MVGLERDFYNADRDDVVAVCITVSSPDIVCPVEFPFSVRVETADGNAGSAIDKLGCDTYLQHAGSFGMCVDSKCAEARWGRVHFQLPISIIAHCTLRNHTLHTSNFQIPNCAHPKYEIAHIQIANCVYFA